MECRSFSLPCWGRRFRRLQPGLFLILLVLATLGGLLYAPNNYDYLSYRFSRVLHWSWQQGWFWIPSANNRMNYSGSGFEWLMAPLFAFFKTDRLFFLINAVPYFLLPGLVFSVFRRLGTGVRAAWHWMWLLPSAYCFVLQSAGAGNDSYAAIYLLAALYYAFRAQETGKAHDVFVSILAAGLLTGVKASNLPLLLPVALAWWPVLRSGCKRPLLLAVVAVMTLMCSFAPMALLNQRQTGHWSGDPKNQGRMQLSDPVSGVIGNSLQLAVGSVAPPVFPVAGWWNKHWRNWLPEQLAQRLKQGYPRMSLGIGELPMEEGAGLGLGVTAALLLGLTFGSAPAPARKISSRGAVLVLWGGLAALLVYLAKMGSESTARILSSYYPLLVAAVLVWRPLLNTWLNSRFWKILSALVLLSAIPVVIVTPSRPLFPVKALMALVKHAGPRGRSLGRVVQVYETYGQRSDTLAEVRKYLPATVSEIGFYQSGDDTEISLWRPFDGRRVLAWESGERPVWVVVSAKAVQDRQGQEVDEWLLGNGYRPVQHCAITGKVQEGPVDWVVAEKLP